MTRCLITAGPTHESIDAVRFIGNRSSGRMGIAIAEAARVSGWDVTLLLGPVCAIPPMGLRVERFTSTQDLARLLDRHFPTCDVLVMAAAVADFRPVSTSSGKLPRSAKLTLELETTTDLVGTCAKKRTHQRIVGFALEDTNTLKDRAFQKLKDKNLDAIVANPLETMDSARVAARIMTLDGGVHGPVSDEAMDKSQFARWLVEWMRDRWFR